MAQDTTPFLERTITITFSNEQVDAALSKISEQAGFTFSYNTSAIDTKKTISRTFTNKTVREVLNEIFDGEVEYKVRSKYIILTKAKKTSKKKNEEIFAGYIIDEATGERIKNASVYDPVTLSSTITDSYGYFELKIDKKPSTDIKLSVNKENYSDTVVAVFSGPNKLLNIPIKINKSRITVLADSVGEKIKRFWNLDALLFKKQNKGDSLHDGLNLRKPKFLHPDRPELVNITDTIYRKVQFSFIPFIGTNHALSGNVINDYSYNILGGYALGVQKFELGGLFNVDRGNVKGGQVAGLSNIVGGTVTGVQFAGLINANYGFINGVQVGGLVNANFSSSELVAMAGLFNVNNGSAKGVYVGGLGNITMGEQEGPQIAGLFNVTTGESRPLQLAGLFNIAAQDHKGSQIGGLFNITARDLHGSQVAGLWNLTGKDTKGSQVAGLLNITGGKVKGSQVSALFNYGTTVGGSQFGMVNIADSVKGISFGLINIVRKGYHKLELSADEIFYTNVAFRTGVRHFYNIFSAGIKPHTLEGDSTFYTFGYGIGTAPKLFKKFYLNVDLTANQIMYGDATEKINLLNKLYVGFDWQTAKKFSITMGVTLNGYITKATYDGYAPLFTDYKPTIITNKDFGNDYNLKMWLGAKMGVRFF